MEVLFPLVALPANQGTEVGWSGTFTGFKKLMEIGQSGSWTSSGVARLLYTSMTRRTSSRLSGFSQVRTHLGNSWDWEALPNKWSWSSLPNPAMWPLSRSRRGRQSLPCGTSTFSRLKSLRLGVLTIQTTAPTACYTIMTPPPPLWSTLKQIAFSWSPRSHIPWA